MLAHLGLCPPDKILQELVTAQSSAVQAVGLDITKLTSRQLSTEGGREKAEDLVRQFSRQHSAPSGGAPAAKRLASKVGMNDFVKDWRHRPVSEFCGNNIDLYNYKAFLVPAFIKVDHPRKSSGSGAVSRTIFYETVFQ